MTKDMLIERGVERLKRFGFDHVSRENIITDDVYKWYFTHMLKNMLGENDEMNTLIAQLLDDME